MSESAASRPLLMIPGPLEFEDSVLEAMGRHGTSHVDPETVDRFGASLEMMRTIFLASDGQPFIVSGSGSLGWDLCASSLLERGDNVLVLNTGYFGDSFGDCCATYGANVTHLRCPVGTRPTLAELEAALTSGTSYRMVTVTHVDTSTGVLVDVKQVASAVRRLQPDALVAVDGVCSVGGEELRMTDWDVDVALTGSQKAVGVPPGLCLLMARPRAMAVLEGRSTPIGSYYASLSRWLPIMQAYEARKPSYFATPAVSHIFALHTSLSSIVDDKKGGVEAFFERHRKASDAFKAAMAKLGLGFVPVSLDGAAHTLSCVRFPEGVTGAQLLPAIKRHGVVAAGGLHKEIKAEYFRVGHMGMVLTASLDFVKTAATAVARALKDCGKDVDEGAMLNVFDEAKSTFPTASL